MAMFEEAGPDGARFLTAGPGNNTKFPSVEVRLLSVPTDRLQFPSDEIILGVGRRSVGFTWA